MNYLLRCAAVAACLALGACQRSAADNASHKHEAGDSRLPSASPTHGSFVSNGDGTVTDVSTGLVWEQKCDCRDTLHHFETTYLWSGDGEEQTIWDWLEALNKEGARGFAGHSDWRIPNVKELVSLVDYERAAPAVSPLLGECAGHSAGSQASGCTASGPYWSSTTFADFPAHALVVGFAAGGVDDQLKSSRALVRAVRGPLPGTAQENRTRTAHARTHVAEDVERFATRTAMGPQSVHEAIRVATAWAGAGARSLHDAVRDGDVETVRKLVESGADVNAADEDGLTPLLEAIFGEQEAIAAAVIKAGADVNQTSDVSGRVLRELGAEVDADEHPRLTPLMVAVFLANHGAVEQLLQARANVNAAGDDGVRPLHLAAFNPDTEIATLLLEAGADVNARSSGGDTPLHEAATRGNAALAALLISRGANVNAIDVQLRTPLDQAESQSHRKLVRVLEKHGAVAMQQSVDANIDVTGHDPELTPLVDAATLEALVPVGARPLGLGLDTGAGRVWWTEYTTDRLQSSRLDGSDARALAIADLSGPIGIAVAPAARKLFWTSDLAYPRKVQRAELDGSEVTDVASGANVNRPSAITVDAVTKSVFWTESIGGRICRADFDGSSKDEIVASGISSVSDRADAREFKALGIAIDGVNRKLYWTDMIDAQIMRADLDGTDIATVIGASAGLEAPAGIVVDADHIYWTDAGASKIQRAKLDGSDIEDVLDEEDGLIEPYALALDHDAGRLYWTDAADGTIRTATLSGQGATVLISTTREFAKPRPEPVDECARSASTAGAEYVRKAANAIATCLNKVDALKAVWRRQADAGRAGASCLRQFDRLAGGAQPSRSIEGALRTRVSGACGARLPKPLGGPVGVLMEKRCAARLNEVECLVSAFRDSAYSRVALRFRRAGEWLEEVRPFMAAGGVGTADVHNAIANLDTLSTALRAMTASEAHASAKAARGAVSRSGQTTSYAAIQADGRKHWRQVPDDGATRSGVPVQYRDNRDGTITDLSTGLMWEKKCEGCGGLHDARSAYALSPTTGTKGVTDWLAEVNTEHGTGYAGHRDWRLPTIKELQSIVDYERFNPAVSPAFDGPRCGLGCSDLNSPQCSCTAMTEYCSTTTYASSPKRAFALGFHLGIIGEVRKADPCAARAVRGGAVEADSAASSTGAAPERAPRVSTDEPGP